jgi:hypothetical protein
VSSNTRRRKEMADIFARRVAASWTALQRFDLQRLKASRDLALPHALLRQQAFRSFALFC